MNEYAIAYSFIERTLMIIEINGASIAVSPAASFMALNLKAKKKI
jgi:hypothetical protein